MVVAYSHSFCYENISALLVKESDTIVLLAIRCLKRKKILVFLSMYSISGVIGKNRKSGFIEYKNSTVDTDDIL